MLEFLFQIFVAFCAILTGGLLYTIVLWLIFKFKDRHKKREYQEYIKQLKESKQ